MQGDNLVSQRIRPLTKAKKTGELYSRTPDVEVQLSDALNLAESEFLIRLNIRDKKSDQYLLDEVLVYFMREALRDNKRDLIDPLFDEINFRMSHITMGSWSSELEDADKKDIHQQVGMRFLEHIGDIESGIGDYAQVRFGDYVSTLAGGFRKSTFKQINKAAQNEELDKPTSDGQVFELRIEEISIDKNLVLSEGFKSLPEQTKIVVRLLADGWAIESKEPDEVTISKYLGVTSRTIRNWINEARETLSEYRGLGS